MHAEHIGKGKSEGLITFHDGADAIVADRTAEVRATRRAALLAATPTPRRKAADAPIEDSVIGGWTLTQVRNHFGFSGIEPATRNHYPIGGPVGITRQIRAGIAGFQVTDMRTGASLRVGSKRTANKVAKAIDDDWLDKSRRYDDADRVAAALGVRP